MSFGQKYGVNGVQDRRIRRFILPVRYITDEKQSGGVNHPDALLERSQNCCELLSNGTQLPWIVVDFGKEIQGGLRIDTNGITSGTPKAKIRIRFGESLIEVMNEPCNDHAVHEFTLTLPGMSTQEFGATGFRFARIDMLEPNQRLLLRQLEAVSLGWEFPWLGSFESSDELLNTIWGVGARTVELCCLDYIVDGIKRDRLAWMGDLHPQIHVIGAAFGALPIVEDTFDYLRETTPTNQWMNHISSYTFWWLLALNQWRWYAPNTEFILKQKGYIAIVLTAVAEGLERYGLRFTGRSLHNPEEMGHEFLDWASYHDQAGVQAGLDALVLSGLDAAGQLMEVTQNEALRNRIQNLRRQLTPSITAYSGRNLQAHALRVLAGLDNAAEVNRRYFAPEPCLKITPWFGYYILQARGKAGDYNGAMALIEEYWGGMIQLGATSFWEDFDVSWLKNAARIDELAKPGQINVHSTYGDHCYKGLRHSLCHGWGGGPTAWLSEHVLGINILAPGFKKVAIRPHLGELSYARGTFPTPYGMIEAAHEKDRSGKIHSTVKVPKEMELVKE